MMRSRASLLLVFAFLQVFFLSGAPTLHAQTTQTFSTVYISPTVTCCGTLNVPYQPGDVLSVSVNMNLVSGESINAFDIRVNYTNPHSNFAQGVLEAISVDNSGGLFSSYNPTVLANCIDGVTMGGVSSAGCSGENVGQVHFAEVIRGKSLDGPLFGSLFSIRFQVMGYGKSLFVLDRTDLPNPTSNISDPQSLNFHLVTVSRSAGMFGNQRVNAFFNFQPVDTSISPSLLPNHPINFDASDSIVANDSSLGFRSYAWNFGDGSPTVNDTKPVHSFSRPGNYTVSLTVWDNKNETDTLSRRVSVLPALGNLLLTVDDSRGNPQASVMVRLFNTSSSSTPFFNQTTNPYGTIRFNALTPGNYYLVFSGRGLETGSKTEKVIPGWTSLDTVYLTSTPVPQDYGGLIYIGTILAGLGIVTGAVVYQKRKSASRSGKEHGRGSGRVKSRTAPRRNL